MLTNSECHQTIQKYLKNQTESLARLCVALLNSIGGRRKETSSKHLATLLYELSFQQEIRILDS